MCRFKWNESLKIGCGMMTRGEVALIISNKGLGVGLMKANYFTAVILLIIVSSIVTPIVLKLCFNRWPDAECAEDAGDASEAPAENTSAPADSAAAAPAGAAK